MNPFTRYNPLRPLIQWYYTRVMDRFLERELDVRFASYKKAGKPESVMDLALEKYAAEQSGLVSHAMDPIFRKFAISQTKVFILAGHDTTSATISYIFYLLAKHPEYLARIQAEHDKVLGPDTTHIDEIITANPYHLNSLPFTLAVIKETLRLFPPASTTRQGKPGFSLAAEDGLQYPTEGFTCWSIHQAQHRDRLYWPQPDAFLPDRWLVPSSDPLYPTKGAWRPFEVGPRNCIGQELVMLEIKVVLALAVREFNIQECFEEWDRMNGVIEEKFVEGERAYQVLKGTMRPVEGMPVRVKTAG